MTDRAFKLEVITPDRVVFSERDIASVVVPGSEGYMGILASHAPLMTELAIGELDFRKSDGTSDAMAVCNGFMEVYENTVTVLAESAELCGEIDVKRAEEAVHRAEERIASHPPDIDVDRARVALMKAMNRLKVAGRT